MYLFSHSIVHDFYGEDKFDITYTTQCVITAPLFCSNRNTIILEFGHRGKVAVALLAYCNEAFTLLAYCILAM